MLQVAKSLKKLLKIISEFSEVAGPKLNQEKTECLLPGSFINMYADEQYINGVKIAENCVKSLGIFLRHDIIQCYEKLYTTSFGKIEIELREIL